MMTWRDGIGGEEGRVVCIIMADLHCMAETNSTVKFFFKIYIYYMVLKKDTAKQQQQQQQQKT